jgi:hypothetical protein
MPICFMSPEVKACFERERSWSPCLAPALGRTMKESARWARGCILLSMLSLGVRGEESDFCT